jgi:hypothetical protein
MNCPYRLNSHRKAWMPYSPTGATRRAVPESRSEWATRPCESWFLSWIPALRQAQGKLFAGMTVLSTPLSWELPVTPACSFPPCASRRAVVGEPSGLSDFWSPMDSIGVQISDPREGRALPYQYQAQGGVGVGVGEASRLRRVRLGDSGGGHRSDLGTPIESLGLLTSETPETGDRLLYPS